MVRGCVDRVLRVPHHDGTTMIKFLIQWAINFFFLTAAITVLGTVLYAIIIILRALGGWALVIIPLAVLSLVATLDSY